MANIHNDLKHVGFIGDGVRRWARKNQVDMTEAYVSAMNIIGMFVDYWFANSVDFVSVYMLSKENLNRPHKDLKAALDGEQAFYKSVLVNLTNKWNCSINLAGELDLLPDDHKSVVLEAARTTGNGNKRLNLLVAYNPIDEIKQSIEKGGEDFSKFLWVKEPLDLVIRTSGERRISNFLPLQSGYAEFYFLDTLLNDLKQDDLSTVHSDFQMRQRRIGR